MNHIELQATAIHFQQVHLTNDGRSIMVAVTASQRLPARLTSAAATATCKSFFSRRMLL